MSLGKSSKVQLPDSIRLSGTRFDVQNLDSIHVLFALEPGITTRRGLYRLTFANGETYVGQAVDVANRYTSHRRRWGDDIQQLEFFPIPDGDLNEPEKQLIHLAELNGPVRNLRDTNRPGGDDTMEVTVTDGMSVSLPWDRSARIKPGDAAVSPARAKFFELTAHEAYDAIRYIAGWFIYNTIPDPFNTQKHLWVTTCLPSTNSSKDHKRLAVISVGSLETLVIMDDKVVGDGEWLPFLFINTVPTNVPLTALQSEEEYWFAEEGSYPYGKTTRWIFTLPAFLAILNGEIDFPHMHFLIESAYELNVRLMRQNGGSKYRRFQNDYLAADLLSSSLHWRNFRCEKSPSRN